MSMVPRRNAISNLRLASLQGQPSEAMRGRRASWPRGVLSPLGMPRWTDIGHCIGSWTWTWTWIPKKKRVPDRGPCQMWNILERYRKMPEWQCVGLFTQHSKCGLDVMSEDMSNHQGRTKTCQIFIILFLQILESWPGDGHAIYWL